MRVLEDHWRMEEDPHCQSVWGYLGYRTSWIAKIYEFQGIPTPPQEDILLNVPKPINQDKRYRWLF